LNARVVTDPSVLEVVWSKQYEKLARVFAGVLGRKRQRVVEIGCGRGQLTIPLGRRSRKLRFVLIDKFVGTNYSKNRKALVSNLQRAGLIDRIQIIISDYMKWISTQDDDTYGAAISSEFIPELNSDETHEFIQECYRILKPDGVTIHSFLSPTPKNPGQKLLITADSNHLWTRTPPKEWFSPPPELVVGELRRSGFHDIRRVTLRSLLIMKADAAKSWLKSAEVKASFYETHERLLNASGLEVPDWIIVLGIK
jgi:cyclopropane fatty-acyl-phospholipid synthase-like methyltransferase